MKIKVELDGGESLHDRLDDAIRALRKLSDCECLQKANDQAPRKLDIVALQGGVDRASKTVERIRRKMLADMLEVISAAAD